jgi:hypothetical protein
MALPIGGKIRRQLSWAMLRTLGEAIGIPAKLAAQIIHEQVAAARTWTEELDNLPYDANRIRNLRRLLSARIKHIEPAAGST